MASLANLLRQRRRLPWLLDRTRCSDRPCSSADRGEFRFLSGFIPQDGNVGRRLDLGLMSLVPGDSVKSVIARCDRYVIGVKVSEGSQFVRYASFAAAKEVKDKEQAAPKQVKEASPEECDQAVEGLSSVKAKAKAKQIDESSVIDKSLLRRLWARLLGIGPALRAVASMSRFFCCVVSFVVLVGCGCPCAIGFYYVQGRLGRKDSPLEG